FFPAFGSAGLTDEQERERDLKIGNFLKLNHRRCPDFGSLLIVLLSEGHLICFNDIFTLKGEHLCLKEETDSAWFQFSAVSIKSEDDEEKPLVSQLHQQQIEDKYVPTSSSSDQMTAETGGGAGTSRNPDLNPHEQTSDSSETEVSGDDYMNPDSGMSDSGSETGDEGHDWNEKRSSESDVKTVNISFSCLECGERFHDKQSLQKHMRVTSHSAIRSSSSLVNKKSVGLKQPVDSYREVQKELKSFSCGDCGKIFGTKSSFNRHQRVHTGQKPFACELCRKRFTQNSTLNDHMRVHTGQKPFACGLCGKRFTRKSNFNRHVRVHTGKKPFACELCGNRFTEKSTLNNHTRVHTGHKPFACELCGNRFIEKSTLNYHMRVHTGHKHFACELCRKRFTKKSGLNRHMRIHTEEKLFACELCGNRFTQKSALNDHMRVHTGQKPFTCELCGKRFTQKSTLNNHMRVHTGHKPFACGLCGKRFTRKSNINSHMKIHTEEKQFACKLCGNRFTKKSSLNNHMRVHTGLKPSGCELYQCKVKAIRIKNICTFQTCTLSDLCCRGGGWLFVLPTDPCSVVSSILDFYVFTLLLTHSLPAVSLSEKPFAASIFQHFHCILRVTDCCALGRCKCQK
uniref:C2H2-type domain-containing protein n=1 Tax=Nothobranchius furzeri TaxID=105023 RepID=A0A8C6LRV4_NOTFU